MFWACRQIRDRHIDLPGRMAIVRDTLGEFDQGRIYPSAEEALTALKAWIESGEKPPKTED
jgi:hypothetical protein